MKKEGWHMMITEEIKLRIHEESDLFSPLDPNQRILSDEVISYLSRNYQTMYQKYQTKNGNYVLHIFSDTPVNEAHVKDAIRGHFVHEKDNIQFLSKIETYKMHALGILGTLFLSASYLLSHYTEGVFVEILTIIGWVAIWEATGGVILRRPELYHFRKKYDFALKTEIIIDVLPGIEVAGKR